MTILSGGPRTFTFDIPNKGYVVARVLFRSTEHVNDLLYDLNVDSGTKSLYWNSGTGNYYTTSMTNNNNNTMTVTDYNTSSFKIYIFADCEAE